MVDRLKPNFTEEEALQTQGYRYIAGVDEVGCGPLAGPVVAAAVVLPHPFDVPWADQVRDSKLLTAPKREILSSLIREVSISFGIGIAPVEVIDAQGLTRARQLAMALAIEKLLPFPDYLLIDYYRLPGAKIRQKGVVNGDGLCFSIACASIVAKVARDDMMFELDKVYPGYGLARNKGYMTREHMDCLRRLGPSPIHRRSFQPVRDAREIKEEYEA